MEDEILYELGVDFGSSLQFENGDIVLAKYDDNLVQSIVNRMNVGLDELNIFYENYGSVMLGFLGWKANDETITFIKAELESILKSEDKVESWEYDVKYTGNGKITIDLTLYPNSEYEINSTLEVNIDGVEEVVIEEED